MYYGLRLRLNFVALSARWAARGQAMDDLRETLPAIQRLALAYAPARTRDATLALLALDGRLAGVLRSASEPMLAQIRLAWWRDILGREAAERPSGEPLVALLEPWGREAGELVALVDGWEQLVEIESFGPGEMRAFCRGRGAAWAGLARVAGCHEMQDAARAAGEGWALADLASRLSASAERDVAARLVCEHDWRAIALPRALRPLAILHGLARRSRGRSAPDGRALLIAMRIGLFGR